MTGTGPRNSSLSRSRKPASRSCEQEQRHFALLGCVPSLSLLFAPPEFRLTLEWLVVGRWVAIPGCVKSIAVIGLGDPDRPAEAVGILVVRALAGRIPQGVTLLEDGDPVSFLEYWEKFEALILVDAVRSGSPPGTVQVFDGRHLPPLVRSGVVSMRGYGVREIIELGEALAVLSKTVQVVGVEVPALETEPAVQAVLAQIALIGNQ